MSTPAGRRAQFADWVRRVTNRAQLVSGWSLEDIAKRSEGSIGTTTLYRWRSGEWTSSPKGDQIAAFCRALSIPPSKAFAILWPDDEQRREPEPLMTTPAIDVIMHKLNDPNVPANEKYLINQTLESLAARPKSPRT